MSGKTRGEIKSSLAENFIGAPNQKAVKFSLDQSTLLNENAAGEPRLYRRRFFTPFFSQTRVGASLIDTRIWNFRSEKKLAAFLSPLSTIVQFHPQTYSLSTIFQNSSHIYTSFKVFFFRLWRKMEHNIEPQISIFVTETINVHARHITLVRRSHSQCLL